MLVPQIWEEVKSSKLIYSYCETLTKRPPAFYKKPLPSLAGTLGDS